MLKVSPDSAGWAMVLLRTKLGLKLLMKLGPKLGIASLIVIAFPWSLSTPAVAQSTAPFTIVTMGDAPYMDLIDFIRFSDLIHRINALAPAFTVHIGDFKRGSKSCSDHRLTMIRDYFDDLDSALIYTPGDNEWTDCHRIAGGGWDPLDRLALLRRHYFTGPASMGRAPIPLTRQSDITAHRKFVENARWSRGGIGFLTAHVVGTYNNAERRDAAARQEFKERDIASSSWIADGFRWATATEKRGLVVFIHGDPLEGRDHDRKIGRGFKRTVAALTQGARRFDKPVLLVHGDFHDYKLDQPFTDGSGRKINNLTRLEVLGAPYVWAVRIKIDPEDPALFDIAPLEPIATQAESPN